jgi:hypothetical protein
LDICKEQITVFREAALFANAGAEMPKLNLGAVRHS